MDAIAMYCGYAIMIIATALLCLLLLTGIAWAWKEATNMIGRAYKNTKYCALLWRVSRSIIARKERR